MKTLLLIFLFTALLLMAFFLPVEQILTTIQSWATENQSSALLIMAACFFVGTLLLLPVSLMTMLAGFLFGLVKGFAVVWAAGLLASVIAFWISRYFARNWIERRVRRNPTFMAIDRAIRRKGLLVVLLTRIVMVLPYTVLNYSLGLTSVSLRNYLIGTGIGSTLPVFLFVYLGTTVSNVKAIIHGDVHLGNTEILIAASGLVVIIAVVLMIVRASGKILKEELLAARQ